MEPDRTNDTVRRLTPGTELSPRPDNGLTALILAVFALAWFGWGEADASAVLSVLLSVGSSGALAVGLLAAIRLVRGSRDRHTLEDPVVRRRYLIVVAARWLPATSQAAQPASCCSPSPP